MWLLCVCVAIPAAYAQEKCNLQMISGTYVGYERGYSLAVVPDPPKKYFPFFTGAMAPFANISHVTFTSDGMGKGYFWMYLGSVGATTKPIPVQVTVTEMNPDCSGKFVYVAGPNGATIEERFILLEDGREIRSLPTSISNGVPGLAWTGAFHRISEGSAPVTSCGAQTGKGRWLTTCENILWWSGDTAWADTLFLREDVSDTGEFTGTLYERLGDYGDITHPIWGKIAIKPDCAYTEYLNIKDIGSALAKGIYFDEGKQSY